MTYAFVPLLEPNQSYFPSFQRYHKKYPRAVGRPTIAFSNCRRLLLSKQSRLFTTIYDDFEDYEPSEAMSSSASEDGSSNEDIYALLRARQDSLHQSIQNGNSNGNSETVFAYNQQDEIEGNWRNAECVSSVRLQLSDWIRRIAIDTYPLAVCGSASGNVYLVDLDRAEELDCITSVHEAHIDDEDVTDAMKKLYGLYDGGGVIAVAIRNDIVVSSGREGGVHVFKIDGEEETYYKGSRGGTSTNTRLHLKSEGKIRYLDSTLVTSLAFDDIGTLWTGGYDGYIRAFEYDDANTPLFMQREPVYQLDVGSEVLSVSVNDEIGCGVAATAEGSVVLFSLEEGEVLSVWTPFGRGVGRRKREYARCAMIVQNDEERIAENGVDQPAVWSVICGGSEGSMYQKRLNIDSFGYVSESKPYMNDDSLRGRLRPSHSGLVMAMASPSPGLLVSGSQDGTIRIWDCSYHNGKGKFDGIKIQHDDEEEEAQYDDIAGVDRRPNCLYAMTGYKVWLGSICTNGEKLITDGSDNTIIAHDFTGDDDSTEGFLFEDDDLEDFSL
jgi:WD40 repeat protein